MCRKINNIDRRKKNIVKKNEGKKKERKKNSENYCNWFTVEFSTIVVMKQDFDIANISISNFR